MHVFHRWKKLYYEDTYNNTCWFKHLQCKKCGKQIIKTKIKFFASISDAIELGIMTGIYKGFHPEVDNK